jgi:hypothetical protein
LAQDPLSQVTMAFAGSSGDISQTTRCGFTGLASAIARPSSFSHQAAVLDSIWLAQLRSSLRRISGSKAFSVSAASPWRLTSAG